MPAFAGVIKISSNPGEFIHGDTLVVSPAVSIKDYRGSGSGTIGDFTISNNLFSITATVDSDLVDKGSTKVATAT
jgi:spore germination protein PF